MINEDFNKKLSLLTPTTKIVTNYDYTVTNYLTLPNTFSKPTNQPTREQS